MKMLSIRDDFKVESGVVMTPLKEEVVSATGYNPDRGYESLGYDSAKMEEYNEKEALARRAELLETRITSTLSAGMSKEERELTMPDRYDKLVQVIKDYHVSDESVQVYVAPILDRAIRSMNNEFSPINADQRREFEQSIRAKMHEVQELSVTAHKDIVELFGDFKKLDPDVQQAVFHDMKDLYRSYMNTNIDSREIKQTVMNAYKSVPKTFNTNITFDVSELYAEQNDVHVAEDVKEKLDSIDVAKLSYSNLGNLVQEFRSYDVLTKAAVYESYCDIIDNYRELHPRSAEAEALRMSFREEFYETVRGGEKSDVIDVCRMINATTTASSRDANLSLVEDAFHAYNKLSDYDKTVVRPALIETVESFNSFELQRVAVPTKREIREEEAPVLGRYSADYYEVRELVSNPNADKQDVSDKILGLELKEQVQLLSLNAVKNSPEYYNVVNEQVSGVKLVQDDSVSVVDRAKAFVSLTEMNRDYAFDKFVSSFNPNEAESKEISEIPGFNDAVVTAYENYLTMGSDHSLKSFNYTLESILRHDISVHEQLVDNVVSYYEDFTSSHKGSVGKAYDAYCAFVEKSDVDAAKETLGEINGINERVSEEYEVEKRIKRIESAMSQGDIADHALSKSVSAYEELPLENRVQLYGLVRDGVVGNQDLTERIHRATADPAFDGVKLLYDIQKADADSISRSDMHSLIDRFSNLHADQRNDSVLAGALHSFYTDYADKHPRIAADSDVKDAYAAALSSTAKLSAEFSRDFNNSIGDVSLMNNSDIMKKLNEFDNLPIKCRAGSYATVARMYFDYTEDRRVQTVNERFDKLLDALNGANPDDTFKFLSEKFDTNVYSEEFRAMSIDKKMEIYKELEALCTENHISYQVFNGNVSTKFEEVTTNFAREAVANQYCREKFCDNAIKLIFDEHNIDTYNAHIQGITSKNVEDGGVGYDRGNEYEKAFYVVCSDIEAKLEASVAEKASIEQFKAECAALADGIDLRQRISAARTVDQLSKIARDRSEDIDPYIANTHVEKVNKFYNSSVSNERFYISSFAIDGGQSNDKVLMEIDRVVNPYCVIAHVPNSDESYMLISQNKIDLGVGRDERDIYSILSGRTVVQANDNLNENIMFTFDKSGNAVFTLPVAEASVLSDDYKPGSLSVRDTYELQDISRSGLQTVLLARNPQTGEEYEVLTRMKEQDIMNRFKTDAIIGDSGNVSFAQGKDVLLSAAQQAIDEHREFACGARIYSTVSDGYERSDAPLLIMESESYVYGGGKLLVSLDDNQYEVLSLTTLNDGKTAVSYLTDDGIKNAVSQHTESGIIKQAFDNCQQSEAPSEWNKYDITTFNGQVCLKYFEDRSNKFAPIYDIREHEGKAVVDVITDSGITSVNTEFGFNDAARLFASRYERCACVEKMALEGNDLRLERIDGAVVATVRADGQKILEGPVVNAVHSGLFVKGNDGIVQISGIDNMEDLVKNGNGVKTGVYMDDGTVSIISGNGLSHVDALVRVSDRDFDKVVKVSEMSRDDFIKQDIYEDQVGNSLFVSRINESGVIENHKLSYIQASFNEADQLIDLVAVASSDTTVKAVGVNGLTPEEFVVFAERVRLGEKISDAETRESLLNLNRGEYDSYDVKQVVEVFNNMLDGSVSIGEIKPIQEAGDIARAYITDKNGEVSLKGIDVNGKSVVIPNPVIRYDGDEMYVYHTNHGEEVKNRVLSSSFGGYAGLVDLAGKESFNYRLVLDGAKDTNHIVSGVDYEKKVEWSLNEKAPSIQDTYHETLGISCNANDGYKIGSGKLSIDLETKLSSKYGVIVHEDNRGAHFTYCNPDYESGSLIAKTLQASKDFLPKEQIPRSYEEASNSNFVVVDYELGLAIKDNGMVYRMRQSDLQGINAINYYDEKIIDNPEDLALKSRFVSASKFDSGREDYVPSVNGWEIKISPDGRPNLYFSESSSHPSVEWGSQGLEISQIAISEDGKCVEAKLRNVLDNEHNTSGVIDSVRLCAPSSSQISAMESATANTVGDANDKIRHYFSQVNDLTKGLNMSGSFDHDSLKIGQYLIVKNSEHDSIGALYKVCGESGEMLIVGGADQSAKHPIMYDKLDSLIGKQVVVLDIPENMNQDFRWASSTVYISDVHYENGKVSFSYGQMDLLNNTVVGPSYTCKGEVLNVDQVVEESHKVEARNDFYTE